MEIFNRQGVDALNKKQAKKKVREIIRCLKQSGDYSEQENCIKVAERKLEVLVKEAPASLVYELGCVYSRFKNSGGMWILFFYD